MISHAETLVEDPVTLAVTSPSLSGQILGGYLRYRSIILVSHSTPAGLSL